MNRRKRWYALLPASMMLGLALPAFSSFHEVSAAEIKGKSIYIDVTTNEYFLNAEEPLELRYKDNAEEEHSLALEEVEEGIYLTTAVPNVVLETEGYYFYVSVNDYASSPIYGGSLLSHSIYDLVSFGTYKEEEEARISFFGHYGSVAENPGATYATQRVWLADGFGVEGYTNAVGYYQDSKWSFVSMAVAVNSVDHQKYYYADIPYNLTSATFLSVSSSDNVIKIQETVNVPILSHGVCYWLTPNAAGTGKEVFMAPASSADSYLLSCVVEAYLTYGKDASNGADEQTVKNLFSTWFAGKSASDDDLMNEKIYDYTGYAANGNSYEGLIKNSQFSVNEKWNTMCSQAGLDPKTGEKRAVGFLSFLNITINSAFLMAGASIGFSLLLVIFIVIKRKFGIG